MTNSELEAIALSISAAVSPLLIEVLKTNPVLERYKCTVALIISLTIAIAVTLIFNTPASIAENPGLLLTRASVAFTIATAVYRSLIKGKM